MKLYTPYLVYGLVLLGVSACAKKTYSPLSYEGKIMVLGMGGGFTGAFSEYSLLDNGWVFRNGNSDTSFIQVGRFPLDETTQMFNSLEFLRLDKLNLDEPGNRYYYIISKHKNNEHKIQWGYKSLENNAPAIFHENFISKVKILQSENTVNN